MIDNFKITKLVLNNFRSYEYFRLDVGEVDNIVITGPNGAGKTNLLEAISMLSPGSGLRRAKLSEMGRIGVFDDEAIGDAEWSVFSKIFCDDGETDMTTSYVYLKENLKVESQDKRSLVVNSKNLQTQSEILEYVRVAWFAPQMIGIFNEASQDRRKFFDALVFSFNREHLDMLNDYNNALKQRGKLLKKRNYDEKWVDSLENVIVEKGIAIAASRLEYIAKVNKLLEKRIGSFPKLEVFIKGSIEEMLAGVSALAAEDYFKEELKKNREDFKELFAPSTPGVHRSDFQAYNLDKDINVSQTSTGEQKLAMISMLFAHVNLVKLTFNRLPVILIDEAPAHLDDKKLAEFYEVLRGMKAQCWFTGTEKKFFNGFSKSNTLFVDIGVEKK